MLVHGTWGRGVFPKIANLKRRYLFRGSKRWFEDGAPFYERLKSLGWPIRGFLWSGANSVHARDSAAKELSVCLKEDLKDSDTTAVIIAHSHGGNVALRALQYLDSSMADRTSVVTLATPFLRVFARSSLQLPTIVAFLVFCAIWMVLSFSWEEIMSAISLHDASVNVALLLAMVRERRAYL
jgi:hypothetical protein